MVKLWRIFVSKRFAIVLMIAMAILLLLGVLLPTLSYHQPEEMVEFAKKHPILFQMGKVFNPPVLASSWTFIILTSLILASTLICTIERLRNREFKDPFMPAEPKVFRQQLEFDSPNSPREIRLRAKKILAARRWQISNKDGEREIFLEAEKGKVFGFWGSIVFHLGLLVIFVGAIASSLTRFNATILITEGQSLPMKEASFIEIVRKPRLDYQLPKAALYLNQFTARFQDERHPVDYTARVTLRDEQAASSQATIKVNEALEYKGLTFMLEEYGFAPLFVIKDKRGDILLDAYMNLRGRLPESSKDFFTVPNTNLTITTRFFPDYYLSGGKLGNRSPLPNNPAFLLTVKEKEKPIFRGLLAKGKEIKFSNLTLAFADLKYWAYFRLVKDLGVPIIFWGFIVGTLGLTVRFFFYERKIRMKISPYQDGSKVVLSGQSRYFPFLLKEELEKVASQIMSYEL